MSPPRHPAPRLWIIAVALAALLGGATPAHAQSEDEARTEFQRQAALFAQHCMKCHTIGEGDRVGPDLKGVTRRREREWLVGFITNPEEYLDSDPIAMQLLEEYNDVRMNDVGLTPADAEALLQFIETLGEGEGLGVGGFVPLEEEPTSTRVALPDEGGGISGRGLLLLAAMLIGAGAIWWRGSPRTAQVLLALAVGVGYWSLGGRAHHRLLGDDQGYAPVQPIDFSHALHAGENGISCLYCHHGADRGPVAGVPATSTCMNCHSVVRRRADQEEDSPEIARLVESWEARDTDDPKPIRWVRVHRLPDFVSFSHLSHTSAGLECQECHGPVETMDRIRQASNLSMGWCVNCHRHEGRDAPTHWKRSNATLDCSACHQ